MVAFILLIVGGLNWLLFGLAGVDVGSWLPGGMSGLIAKVVYILVGLAAVYELLTHKSGCMTCSGGGSSSAPAGGGMSSGGGQM